MSDFFATFVAFFMLLICLGIFLAIPGALVYWMVTEATVESSPGECFDVVRNCEIVQIQHQFTLFNPACTDSFLYTWTLPNSPVVYQQLETRARTAEDCTPTLNVGVENASFSLGLTSCFSLQPRFSAYVDSFNCAAVADKKNGTLQVPNCETIFSPTTDHSATLAFISGPLILIFWCCGVLGGMCEE